jgi:plastocyanin
MATCTAVLLIATAGLLGASCSDGGSSGGSSTGASPSGHKATQVQIKDFAFHPSTLQAKAGTKIAIKNDDKTIHTFTADDGAFDTGQLQPGDNGTVTVKKPGTYEYHCDIHEYMTGTIKAT